MPKEKRGEGQVKSVTGDFNEGFLNIYTFAQVVEDEQPQRWLGQNKACGKWIR